MFGKQTFTALLLAAATPLAADTATGVVFHDLDGDEVFTSADQPLGGVRVSNGVDIVTTGADGRYELEVDNDDIIFVIKPRGFRTPHDEQNKPRFYYIHKPAGSPDFDYAGVAPTGPLPDSIDFPLYAQDEPNTFRAVLWADPQPRNQTEIEYITRDVIDALIGVEASFGVTLGDIMFDDLDLMDELNMRVAMIGIPWYNAVGNHDLNFDAPTDELSDETFERIYGPNYYSFDYGPVHFIVMDTVDWTHPEGADRGSYEGGIDEQQIAFIENDLAGVPENKLIVLLMHIPLTTSQFRSGDRERLFALMDDRPHTLSIAGHTHYQQHVFAGEELGWNGAEPHHHMINVTVSGSWWSGAPDELGIPHTTMRDGAPNGYSIIEFDGTDYVIDFVAARRPADYQMNIHAPDDVNAGSLGDIEVVVNVFAGSERSITEMKVGAGEWMTMERFEGRDPHFLELKAIEETENPPRGRNLPGARDTGHLWRAAMPADLSPGAHTIHIRSTDMFGRVFRDERVIVVR